MSTAEIDAMVAEHDLSNPSVLHTNLEAPRCVCRGAGVVARPPSSGDGCADCGGITVRTGTCTTCTVCGTSGGCG